MKATLSSIASVADDFHTYGIEPCELFTEKVIIPILTERALLVLGCLTKHSSLPIRISGGTTIDNLHRAGLIATNINPYIPSIAITKFGQYIYDWYLNHQDTEQLETEPEPIDDVLTVLNNSTLMSELVKIAITECHRFSGVYLATTKKLLELGFVEKLITHQSIGSDYVDVKITERGKQAIRVLQVGVVTAMHPGLVGLLEGFNDKDECMLDNLDSIVCLAQQLALIQRPMFAQVGTVNGKVKYLLTQQGMNIKTILTI